MSNASVRLAAARHAGDDGEAVARHLDVDVLQVVLARVVDPDDRVRRRAGALRGSRSGARCRRQRRRSPIAGLLVRRCQRARPYATRASRHDLRRRARRTTTRRPRRRLPGPRSMIQSAARDHVEVVLDHQQRMARLDQLAGTRAAASRCRRSAVPSSARRTGTACRARRARMRQCAPLRPDGRRASGAALRRRTAWAPAGRAADIEADVGERLQRGAALRGSPAKNSTASRTVMSSTSAICAGFRRASMVTSSISAR